MNQMNMNGGNMPNGVAPGMVGMNNGANGAATRPQSEADEYKTKLNTYIYDYLLKNEQYECARALLNSSLNINSKSPGAKKRDADAMDTDSKDDIDHKKPADLPLPDRILDQNTENSFLLDWFTLFWEIFLAPRSSKPPKLNPNAVQYTNHIRDQSRARQEAQNNFLRQPMGPNMQQQQYQLMQQMRGMPGQMGNDLRARLGARGPLTQQQQQQLMHNQLMRQQQMERGGSEVDMNGQRPRTPSSAMMPGMEGMPEFYSNAQMRPGVPQQGNGSGNHALQDYQMQLMLLEQQNKKRLLMARQEQETLRPDQQGNMAGTPFQAPGMSPQGSRSGPSPNPSDQMKRGTPKMGQAGLPGSPMPDGSMNRASPGAMNFNNVPPEMMQAMGGKMEGMPMGPNGGPMRPPSSHPGGFGQPMQQQMAAMRAQQAAGQMPNGANWPQGPQGQGMMNPQAQQMQQQQQQQAQQGQQPGQQPQNQQGQMGTPQQRNAAMPPPPATGGAANGRPASPAQSAASTTPQQSNKANPKDKKTKPKRPNKKASTTAATPSAEGDASAPTPTPQPQTPLTPMTKGFNEQMKNGQQQQQPANAGGAGGPNQQVAQPQLDTNMMSQFDGMGDGIEGEVNMEFGALDTGDVLTTFDFDAFLQEDGGSQEFDISAFGNYDGLEAGGDAS